jgi:hypothetical protein
MDHHVRSRVLEKPANIPEIAQIAVMTTRHEHLFGAAYPKRLDDIGTQEPGAACDNNTLVAPEGAAVRP